MANTEGMDFKFQVLKNEDILKYLSMEQISKFAIFVAQINLRREQDGKPQNEYLVINTDEPYADEVIDIMKRHGDWG